MTDFQYTECGLTNVFIKNANVVTDDKGNQVYTIQNVNLLHKVIAYGIVQHQNSISGAELRFLRTEMGKTQAELAQHVHKELLTIGRWERGESPIDANAEVSIRLLAIEELKLDGDLTVAEAAKKCIAAAKVQRIDIDGSDPNNYQKIAA